jgi:nucleotide-binding universal stress UspA family protein
MAPAMQFDRILCATDFSKTAEKAFDYAVLLGERCRAEVQLLHVYPLSTIAVARYRDRASGDGQKDHYDARLCAAAERFADSEVVIKTLCCEGVAWERIVAIAKELQPALVVLGRNGRAGMSQLFVGTTATRVVKHASVPVMTVRG